MLQYVSMPGRRRGTPGSSFLHAKDIQAILHTPEGMQFVADILAGNFHNLPGARVNHEVQQAVLRSRLAIPAQKSRRDIVDECHLPPGKGGLEWVKDEEKALANALRELKH